jgi:nucleotide-binding universal stress UspA family protein
MNCGSEAELKVINVVDLFEPLLALNKEKAMEQAHQYIATVVGNIQTALPHAKVFGDVLIGYPDQVITKAAHEFNANLIVMGSHGRTGLTRFLWGSVSRAVLLGAPCAVRIVRQTDSHNTRQNNHVLIALDESEDSAHSAHILQHVLESSWSEGTRFKCISVVSDEYKYVFLEPPQAAGLAVQQEDTFSHVASSLRQRVTRLNLAFGEGTSTFEVLEGDPRLRILEAADNWNAGLIVMGSHARKPIEAILLGSVSDAVSSHAHCAVEITRIPAKKPEEMHAIV